MSGHRIRGQSHGRASALRSEHGSRYRDAASRTSGSCPDPRRERVNKSGLVAEVAKRTERNKADVARILDQAMSVIRDSVAKGERVSLVGFGTFEKRRRNRRVARNPRKPEVAVPVPARDVPAFAPGQAFRQAVAAKRRRPSVAKAMTTSTRRAAPT